MSETMEYLREKCTPEGLKRLQQLGNPTALEFISRYLRLTRPDSVYVADDSAESTEYIRRTALENGEERKLAMEGHTVHFDGPNDQARDKERTCYLLPPELDLGSRINSIDRDKGLEEITGLLDGIMEGKEVFILFFRETAKLRQRRKVELVGLS